MVSVGALAAPDRKAGVRPRTAARRLYEAHMSELDVAAKIARGRVTMSIHAHLGIGVASDPGYFAKLATTLRWWYYAEEREPRSLSFRPIIRVITS